MIDSRLADFAKRCSRAPLIGRTQDRGQRDLCVRAGDIEAGLAAWEAAHAREDLVHEHFFRAAILYDLAGVPGTAASIAQRNGLDPRLADYFARFRDLVWGALVRSTSELTARLERHGSDGPTATFDDLFERALGETVAEYGRVFQHGSSKPSAADKVLDELLYHAGQYVLRFGSDELAALRRTLAPRRENATLP